ncbi:MAG: hypothetical protein WC620_05980 [Methanoregula sp.]
MSASRYPLIRSQRSSFLKIPDKPEYMSLAPPEELEKIVFQ